MVNAAVPDPGHIPFYRTRAWRIAMIYAVVSLLWIWFSDRALLLVYSDPQAVVRWSVYKGMAFVLLTSLMLWLLIRQAVAQLRDEKQLSESMIESMPGVVYFYDMSGRFLRWNQNFERVSGYSKHDLARMHPLDFVEGADRKRVEERIERVFDVGESSVEAGFLHRDGTKTPYFFTGRRVTYQDAHCLIGIGIDISERTAMERELRELNQTLEARISERTADLKLALVRAEEADQTKSAFLATMSHELRTPLNSIIGFTGILLQGLAGALNEEQRKQMGMVQASARHLLALINDVLDLSKIEAGQLSVSRASFDVALLLEPIVQSVRPLADARGLNLGLDAAHELGAITSDARRVEQIVLNLVNNAIKFTDAGSVTVRAARTAASIEIEVTDTGCGIREEDLVHLFTPFVQVEGGLTRSHEGTGLGLAISHRLAAMLDGEIEVESTWQKGSTFRLVLPL